jgi:hypothetical protein
MTVISGAKIKKSPSHMRIEKKLISVQVMKGNTVRTPEKSKFAIPTIKRNSPTMMKIINEQTILGSVKSTWLIGTYGIDIVLGIG